ncbi:MAG: YitT family protein [Clostridiales bacterium]|nr:YitT family protein [Clostridiales bacterium]
MGRILNLERKMAIYETNRLFGSIGGVLLYAIGVNLFIVPQGLYTGGVMGLCQVIRTVLVEYMKLPIHNFDIAGLIYYIVNIPLFILAMKKLGRIFFAKTVICVTAMSFFLFIVYVPSIPIMDDKLASCLIGGILCGAGIGICLKMGSSDGGTDILGVLLIHWKKDFSVGKVTLAVNVVLYLICLFLFDVETVIYSLIYASVSAFAVDKVYSQNINVEVNIITKHACEEMEQEIFSKLERGITKWQALGAYTDNSAEVLYMVISKYEVGRMKNIIRKYDPNAFIVINEGVNVSGNFLKKL